MLTVAIGALADVNNLYNVAIGYQAEAHNAASTAVGEDTYAYDGGTAIGRDAIARHDSVVIGKSSANATNTLSVTSVGYMTQNLQSAHESYS